MLKEQINNVRTDKWAMQISPMLDVEIVYGQDKGNLNADAVGRMFEPVSVAAAQAELSTAPVNP